jgi:hypothetical protein
MSQDPANQLGIYVSASSEMDAECELLGQLLASLPRSVRWNIKRTPGPHEEMSPDLEALFSSRFYVVLLGMDIMAPIGVELQAAQSAGLWMRAYRCREKTPSPAAAYFAQNAQVEWRWYETPHDFVGDFEKGLIQELLQGTPGYGLTLRDLEELTERIKAIEEGEEAVDSDDRRGAGRGGVILPTG